MELPLIRERRFQTPAKCLLCRVYLVTDGLLSSEGWSGRDQRMLFPCNGLDLVERGVYRYGDSNPGPVAENHVS